jgi:type I restriction-modification system DNA methylase subunit
MRALFLHQVNVASSKMIKYAKSYIMIKDYLARLNKELASNNALEHSYRPALKDLIEKINPDILAVNEPARSSHGAPDFVFLNQINNTLIRGYAETKDINANMDQVEKTEQIKRYLGYSNLLLTNYIEFRFFRNGEKYQTILIAKKEANVLVANEDCFDQLQRELRAFLEQKPENITNARRLAQIMGGKAARIRDNVANYLQTENLKNEELLRIYKVMKKLLVHDLEIAKFADMYAQTLVYGLFVARYYDRSPNNFSRQEARDLIPASNSFLQHFFDHIAGVNFDRRLTYIVDELCEVFQVSDVRMIIQKHYNLFGEATDKDPIIHFYEDFLKEYDPQLRKSMGAYYTPVPVVDFIIRAVDDVLRNEFNIIDGLASTEKIQHETVIQGKKKKIELHRVQILDPAVGTATFLNEAVKFIYKKFESQEGLWKGYVDQELLPRLYGFELMMAPYTIAHLKLAMTLKETGVDQLKRRLGVYLTNTLEEGVRVDDDLFSFGFAEAISEEAMSASVIKHKRPIMIVLGNPPYSGESFNKGDNATKLVSKYKFEPGGKEKLREKNPKWINDDYVKFIAFAEEMVSKTGEGVVSMITNHGYIDNRTFRGMRWHLAKTFSSIYVLDLHGNTKKREVAPNNGKDENVFNIQQGEWKKQHQREK